MRECPPILYSSSLIMSATVCSNTLLERLPVWTSCTNFLRSSMILVAAETKEIARLYSFRDTMLASTVGAFINVPWFRDFFDILTVSIVWFIVLLESIWDLKGVINDLLPWWWMPVFLDFCPLVLDSLRVELYLAEKLAWLITYEILCTCYCYCCNIWIFERFGRSNSYFGLIF